MTDPAASSRGDLVLRVIGAVLAGVLGVVLILLLLVVFQPGSSDPHGYGLLFGTILALPVAFGTAAFAPLAFPRRLRARAYAIAGIGWVVLTAALIIHLLLQ